MGHSNWVKNRQSLGGSRTVISKIAPIPKKIVTLAHDALVTLRNAVEHTLFIETEFLNGGPLKEELAKQVQMPACETQEKFENWLRSKNKNRPQPLSESSVLSKRIDPLQPFQWQDDAPLHPLALLTSYTNHFKHRGSVNIAMRISDMYRDDQRPKTQCSRPERADKPAFVGEVLAHTSPGQQIPFTMFPAVSINRPKSENWPILMNELDEIASWVRLVAVPRIITGEQSPEPAIPARYDINVGHADERSAISKGSMTTAAQISRRRHGAAVTRLDFVDILSGFSHAPDASGIAAWADQLGDSEVLERIERVQVTDSSNLSIAHKNLRVLSGLAEEAANYVRNQKPGG